MLTAMWLFRIFPSYRGTDRFGPFKTHVDRRDIAAEIWAQYPDAVLYDVDVYDGGDVRMTMTNKETP